MITIDKFQNISGGSGHILCNQYRIKAEVALGDTVSVETECRRYHTGVVAKITEKTVTVISDYNTPYADSHRFRMNTFIDRFVKVENDTFSKELVKKIVG